LQPSFLAAHFWVDAFVDNLDPNTHLIIDGSPRRMLEARIMDEALEFYKRFKPVVLHIDITREETFNRLADRGRNDDTDEGIKRRLDQYEAETQPVIEHYQDNDEFRYERIDGMQSVNEVESEIRSVIDLAA
jgi:adenylate kinase